MTLKQMSWDQFEEILATELPGFKRREIQATLAQNALDSLTNQRHILAQAGCGTGKSFIAAFVALMKSLMTGKPSGIATATKALQDQYSEKDLPFLAKILPGLQYAVLKGRGNYVCMQKVDEIESGDLKSRILTKTDEEGFSGEIMDLGFDVDPKQTTSTSDECPGKKECPFGEVCFAERAKTKAKTSHIVIANHAVLAADLMVREMQEQIGIPEDKTVAILPHLGTIIIDEAHEFQDSVTNALGGDITAGSFGRLFKEIDNWFGSRQSDQAKVAVEDLFRIVARILGGRQDKRATTLPLNEKHLAEMAPVVVKVAEELAKIIRDMKQVQIHGNDKMLQRRKRLLKRIDNTSLKLKNIILADEESLVRWLEVGEGKKGDAIAYAPLDIAPFLADMLWTRMPAMLMSATLALGNDFSFIQEQLGIE